jgi:hypothetical protein
VSLSLNYNGAGAVEIVENREESGDLVIGKPKSSKPRYNQNPCPRCYDPGRIASIFIVTNPMSRPMFMWTETSFPPRSGLILLLWHGILALMEEN